MGISPVSRHHALPGDGHGTVRPPGAADGLVSTLVITSVIKEIDP
jgi:hypothetical protein